MASTLIYQLTDKIKPTVRHIYADTVEEIIINILPFLLLYTDQHNNLEDDKKCNDICIVHFNKYNIFNQVNLIANMLKLISKILLPVLIVLLVSKDLLLPSNTEA